ncbi:hypothetical protein MBLNU13_g00071t3 [Cladosporium sp. NU13]
MDNTPNIEVVFEAENSLANDQVDAPCDLMLALPPGTALIIRSDDRSWRVHKEALCMRSKYFDLACNGPFPEASQDHMTLHDDEPDAVHDMLTYLMFDSYGPAFVDSAVDTHIAACDIADKYMLPGLQSLAVANFKECMFRMWEERTSYDPTSAFAEVVERVYEDPRDLWDDPLKQALRAFTVLRLVQMLPPRWQKQKYEHDDPPNEWLAQWGEVAGTRVEPDAPRFLADFWGDNSKLYGWWFKNGFPGMMFERGWRGNEQEEGRCDEEGGVPISIVQQLARMLKIQVC